MAKLEHRTMVKYSVFKGLKAMKIHGEMVENLGESAPSKTMVCE